MQRGVGIGGISVKTLADEEARFAMRIPAAAEKGNVCRECHVAGNFLPNEMKRVIGKPHVLPAAGDRVSAADCIVLDGPGAARRADLAAAGEKAGGIGLR